MVSKQFHAAIDLSGPFSSFSLLDAGKDEILVTESVMLENRNNFSFFNNLFFSLDKLGVGVDEIKKWYVGIGPGSFTGLRVAASFVLGITFAKEGIEVQSIPSAFPVAAKVNSAPGDKLAVLYYASRGEVLLYSIDNDNGTLCCSKKEPALVGVKQLLPELEKFDYIVYVSNKFIDEALPRELAPKTEKLDIYPVELLFENKYSVSDYSLGDLTYVRAATSTS